MDDLEKALKDESPDVSVVAAEALYYLGEKKEGIDGMLAALDYPDPFVRTHALNAIDYTNEFNPKIKQAILDMVKKFENEKNPSRYDLRVVEWLLDKNGIDRSKLMLNSAREAKQFLKEF